MTRKSHPHPLSIPNGSAWASDEHILPTGRPEKSALENCGSIVVAHEVSVRSDIAEGRELSLASTRMHRDNWGPSNVASAGANITHNGV